MSDSAAYLFLLFSATCPLALAMDSTVVHSAVIENVRVNTTRGSVGFDIRNVGHKEITGFQTKLVELPVKGEDDLFCNGGGMDMLDHSDAMPGTGLYANFRREWIISDNTLYSERYFLDCKDLVSSPERARIEITLITFSDGTWEGDEEAQRFFYRVRKGILDERQKWLPRFTALRASKDVRPDIDRLYKDLTARKFDLESKPDMVGATGLRHDAVEQLQKVARQIKSLLGQHISLEDGSLEMWLITDLEDRTERLSRGVGIGVQ